MSLAQTLPAEDCTRLVDRWFVDEQSCNWALGQTNVALADRATALEAERMLTDARLPTHPDRPKNWDGFLALFHTLSGAGPLDPVLDAGAERYSNFLPALRRLGYQDLTGINLSFDAPFQQGGIHYQPGDITRTGFPDRSFAAIASLSVIEHGVDVPAFLAEASRLLRPGGLLFLSFDYWITQVDTGGQSAYGVPIRIFTQEDIIALLASARRLGLVLDHEADFTCRDQAVHWQRFDLRYTFANILLRKA